jgi:hypothetical protein
MGSHWQVGWHPAALEERSVYRRVGPRLFAILAIAPEAGIDPLTCS